MAAEAAISSTVELLGDLLIEKVKSLQAVEGNVRALKEELEWMQSFLNEANKKQGEDDGVRQWIKKVREVAQDAEDTIEMFTESRRNKGFLSRCTGFAKRMHRLDRIGDEIESIRARLDAIDKSRERYGIRALDVTPPDSNRRSLVELRRRLSPWQKDEHLVGIEADVEKLLRESVLDKEKRGLSVAVIEGMGGIGKSTLAREIYNHSDVVAADRFECRGWVVVSSEFTLKETLKQLILEMPGSDKRKLRELEETTKDELYFQRKLQEMLHEQLRGKKYFIVLDDLWEKEHWECLKSAFPHDQDRASRLLLTTRNKTIAKYGEFVHEMKALDSNESWELLLNKAFIGGTNTGESIQKLENIGRQILEKCHGLPLAISVVGGLLVETQTKSGWEQVLNQINSYLLGAESSVSTILELSYQDLSPQMKSCFLCLAFFKEDSTIPAKRLVDIWVGQGLIQHEGNRTVDEIARGYLNELINRSMVQTGDLLIDDRVETCSLHDLLREVCLRKAKEEIGLEIVKGEEGVSSLTFCRPRHRVVYGKDLEASPSDRNKYLRSLFLINVNGDGNVYINTPSHYWKSFHLLKTLDLDGFAFRRFPRSFRLLISLKCLRIHKSHNIFRDVMELPSWLNSLRNLEVLCVDNQFVEFPNVALKMENIRHFHVHSVYGRPMIIEKWKNIESLKLIRLEDWLECSSRRMASCRLRELGIYMNQGEGNEYAMKASMEKMTNLVELHLEFNPLSLMNSRAISHLNSLTRLKLDGGILKCLGASEFPPNLSHLTLEYVKLVEDPMPELGKLPQLQYLRLSRRRVSDEEEWRMRVLVQGFPSLEALSLRNMKDLRGIDVEEGAMPRLKQLWTHKCPNFDTKNLPEHIISAAEMT